ncbi:MAG TPA: clan AA aspartic protease [Pyrinomonadaceae bacterium]|nr:clan AA aspartic protease [Pyrinomonadaceae bacterium]
MGLTHVAVKLRNRDSKETFTADFLIDTGATDSMVPASELKRIGIQPIGTRAYELADGQLEEFQVGYAEFSFMDDTILGRVIFGPDNVEPILGAIALESVGVVVDPVNHRLIKLRALSLK